MDRNEKHIDQILLNKHYNELTADELELVKTEISSETEYNDLRTMLIAAQLELLSAEQIEPKSSTKDFLMNEFSKVHPAVHTNSRSGGLGFLFPSGKAFYQKPGYQLIAIAAVIVLIFTIYPKLSNDITSTNEVALNTVQEKKDSNVGIKKETNTTDENLTIVSEELKNENSQDLEDVSEASTGFTKDLQFEENLSASSFDWDNTQVNSTEKVVSTGASFASSEDISNDEILAEQPTSTIATFESSKAPLSDATILSGGSEDDSYSRQSTNTNNATESSNDMAVAANEVSIADKEAEENSGATPALAKMENKDHSNKKTDIAPPPVKKIKSLAENAELIDLFYTAM